MEIVKLITGFSSISVSKLTTLAQHVIDSLTGHAVFTDATPPLADVQQVINKLLTLNAGTGSNSKADTESKEQTRLQLIMQLNMLALYVQANGKNDTVLLLSSGFNIHKAAAPIGVLDQAHDLRGKNNDGVAGSVKLMVAPVPNANGYIWQYTEAPITDTTVWQTADSTSANITLQLKSRTEYVFCVAGIGTNPTRTFSDRLTFFVL